MRNMKLLLAIFVSLWPTPSQAAIWACPQADGSILYTDIARGDCQLFIANNGTPIRAEDPEARYRVRRAQSEAALSDAQARAARAANQRLEDWRRDQNPAAPATSTPEPANSSVTPRAEPMATRAAVGNTFYSMLLQLAMVGGAVWILRRTFRKSSPPQPPRDIGTISIEFLPCQPPLPSWTTPADPAQYDYDLVPFETDDGQGRGYVVQRLSDGQRMNWHIHNRRQGFESIEVSGESHHRADLQADSFRPPARLTLVPEPSNRYDPHAVAVWDADQQHQAGYIPRDEAERIGMRLRRGHVVECLSMWEVMLDGQRVSVRLLVLYQEAKMRRPPTSVAHHEQ